MEGEKEKERKKMMMKEHEGDRGYTQTARLTLVQILQIIVAQWRNRGGGETRGPHSPIFQNMILKTYPKMLERFSRRAFPHIC